jgi:hypothetical protein
MDVDLAAGATAIADPARAAMLDALLDGVPRSAGALARWRASRRRPPATTSAACSTPAS